MTVGELRKRLDGLPDDMPVLVREPAGDGNWENVMGVERSAAKRFGPLGWQFTMGDEDEESILLIHS